MIHQLVEAADAPCAYVVVCPVERLAALVHPGAARPDRLGRLLAELDARLVFVLDTAPPTGGRPPAERERFRSLVHQLGLGGTDLEQTPGPAERSIVEPHAAWVRPLRAWSTDALLVQVGDRFVELATPARDDLPAWVSDGTGRVAFAPIWGRASLALGSLSVELVPLPERPATLAYRVGDHVFTGAPLLTAAGVSREEATPASLLALPPDTILRPSRLVGGVGIGTVGLERLWLAPAGEGATPDAPRGRLTAEGYVELAPAEAWRHQTALRVVDVRAGRVVDRIPDAEVVPLAALRERAARWRRDDPLLLVCDDGAPSARAAAIAVRLGFSAVYHLAGGLSLWREEGLPLRALALPSSAEPGSDP